MRILLRPKTGSIDEINQNLSTLNTAVYVLSTFTQSVYTLLSHSLVIKITNTQLNTCDGHLIKANMQSQVVQKQL